MPFLVEDKFVNEQATTYDVAELEDCAIGVDASYYLKQLLDSSAAREPLLSALGGLTGFQAHIKDSLDAWAKHNIIPFFVFDGQSVTGQDEITLKRALAANRKTDEAWNLYSNSEAEAAVQAFGDSPGAFRIQNLYPVLQDALRERNLHFLVAPYNASAQLAYFEMIDSDQCAGVMGSQELLMYPIKDTVIREFDWENKKVTAISKSKLLQKMAVSEPMLIDALLMSGTSFLSSFPPLQDSTMYPDGFTVHTAVNLLRTEGKVVANACAAYNDMLRAQDPNWLDNYQKARMVVHHFIYISEEGEVRVHNYDRLTKDNHEYLGLQLPAELFHYLSTGLIGPRILNCITHSQIVVQPTLDGSSPEVYRKLVTNQLLPIKEQSLALIIPRVHRGIGHKAITMRVWFDSKYAHTMAHGSIQPPLSQTVGTWDVKEDDLRQFFPPEFAGPVSLEVLSLASTEFVAKTFAKERIIKGIDSPEMVVSIAIWRFLHLRGYVNDDHKLTRWGNALATTLLALKDSIEDGLPGLDEAALLAFELIRFGLLNGNIRGEQSGLPRKGTDEEKSSLVLISQCASLLRLKHQICGYTGPLNKSLLAFRALSSSVRETDRDLIEAIVASMFMYGQSKRERDDQLSINQRLPFLTEPDIALGIAVRTFFDEDDMSHTKEQRAARLEGFPTYYVPYAEDVAGDIRNCCHFVDALNKGVQTLDSKELPAADKTAFAKAHAYLEARPF